MLNCEQDNSLLTAAAESSKPVVLLQGPACSGKTAAVTAMTRRFSDDLNLSRCLVIVPNAPACTAMRSRLLEESQRDILAKNTVTTFASLAAKILSNSPASSNILPAFERRIMLADILQSLHKSHSLGAIYPIATTPGIVDLLDRSISELKRSAIDPATLADALGDGYGKSTTADLAKVYTRYQEKLLATNAVDIEGQLWLARDLLVARQHESDTLPFLDDFDALAVDGFTDFTPTQLEIISILAKRMTKTLITSPLSDDARGKMWAWTNRTAKAIRNTFVEDLHEITVGEKADHSTNHLSQLWSNVFDYNHSPVDEISQVAIIVGADIDNEILTVAQRIKKLLLDSSADHSPSIAVLTRNVTGIASKCEEIFSQCGIPVSCTQRSLPEEPVIGFLLDVASLASENSYEFSAVLSVINNSYFQPASLGDFDAMTVQVAQMLIREGNILSGKDAATLAAQRLARWVRSKSAPIINDDGEYDEVSPAKLSLGPIEVTADMLTQAAEMLQCLFVLSENAQKPEGLANLADALNLADVITSLDELTLVARDLNALDAFSACIESIGERLPRRAVLIDALSQVNLRGGNQVAVEVLGVLDARAMRFDHVFLIDLADGSFPPTGSENCLINEATRRQLAKKGITLDSRSDLAGREMLLFYLAMSRADKTLTLSYSNPDGSDGDLVAGSFLLSAIDVLGGEDTTYVKSITEYIPPGRIAPPSLEIARLSDARNAAISSLFDISGKIDTRALAAISQNQLLLDRIAQGLWVSHKRWQRGDCDSYDGRISDGNLLKILSQRYPSQTVFSATKLNCYGQCPWQFFASYELKLKPLAQVQRQLEPVTRGIFCHDVLYRLMIGLAKKHNTPVILKNIESQEIAQALDIAIASASAEIESRKPPYEMLWSIQRKSLRKVIYDYLMKQRLPSRPTSLSLHFELSFGLDIDTSRSDVDPASQLGPVMIDTGSGAIMLRGKADRVDLIAVDGEEGLIVVDYKYSTMPSAKAIIQARDVQLTLYSEVIAKLLNQKTLGGAYHQLSGKTGEQYAATIKKYRDTFRPNTAYEQNHEQALEQIWDYVCEMASGKFDVAPATDKCPAWCEFKQICRQSPTRRKIKQGDW